MDKLAIKYRTAGKALPPQPIRLEVAGWGGSPDRKKEDGSEPQPWHCTPFSEGATCGVELLYQYDNECHIVNDTGQIRIDWDFANEPGGGATPDEFSESEPRPSQFYFFATSVDLQAPPGYVLRTEPHPRFFTDTTGTVPPAVCAQVMTHWWPKKLFVGFKAPPLGQRHIFRKGEPYVQILFVPQHTRYETTRMSPEEETRRVDLEAGIHVAKSLIATRVWHDLDGHEFNDHYRVLARAFDREGHAGVEAAIHEAVERHHRTVPRGRTMAEYLSLARQYQRDGKYVEAKQVLFHTLTVDPYNAEASNLMAILGWTMGLKNLAVSAMRRAVLLKPQSPLYPGNLGEILRHLGRHEEAEASLRMSLQLNPGDPQVLSNLGLVLVAQGRVAEGLEVCQAALALTPRLPIVPFRLGTILAGLGRHEEARQAFRLALDLAPDYTDAQLALQELPPVKEPQA
jgi:Flp pilus assembly protein TadD